MKKQLVGVDNLEGYICRASGTVYADGTILLTSGAKDELGRRGIPIVYGPRPAAGACAPAVCCPPGCGCGACSGAESEGPERLVLAVASILKDSYGVTDPEQLRTLSCHVVKTIRENI